GEVLRIEARRLQIVESVVERPSFDELHAEKPLRQPFDAVFVDGHDVRMFELPGDPCLFGEATDFEPIVTGLRSEDLDRHLTKDVLVERADSGTVERRLAPA